MLPLNYSRVFAPLTRQCIVTLGSYNSSVIFHRCLSNKPEEISIAVPWGQIAGKWWNRDKSEPILAVHGWLGNSSTFDRLVPMLSDELSILAVDLPGYGHSSHFPPGCYYHRLNLVIVLRRIVMHFKWEKISLLGHAMGGGTALVYSSSFPDSVRSLSIINAPVVPIPLDEVKYLEAAGLLIDNFIEKDILEVYSNKKTFTKEEMFEIAAVQFDHVLSKESLGKLLERDVKCVSDGMCYFTHDTRVHDSRLSGWGNEETLQIAEDVKTHVLVIIYDESPYYMRKEDFFECWEVIKQKALSASLHIVHGGRHDLWDNPEGSAQILNEHLIKYHLTRKDKKS